MSDDAVICGHRRHRWPHWACDRIVADGYCLRHAACKHPQWDTIEQTWHWQPFGTFVHYWDLKRYCHRCGTDVHWWFQKAQCRHYRRWHIKGRFPSR